MKVQDAATLGLLCCITYRCRLNRDADVTQAASELVTSMRNVYSILRNQQLIDSTKADLLATT